MPLPACVKSDPITRFRGLSKFQTVFFQSTKPALESRRAGSSFEVLVN